MTHVLPFYRAAPAWHQRESNWIFDSVSLDPSSAEQPCSKAENGGLELLFLNPPPTRDEPSISYHSRRLRCPHNGAF